MRWSLGPDDKILHHITMPGPDTHEYLVQDCIVDKGAAYMQGRGCRIFTVEGDLVIKDTWKDRARVSEGELHEQILLDIISLCEPGWDESTVRSHFVEFIGYGDVLIGGQLDSTLITGIDDDTLPALSLLPDPKKPYPDDSRGRSIPSSSVNQHVYKRTVLRQAGGDNSPPLLQHRVHHRSLSKYAGPALHDLKSPKEALEALCCAVTGEESQALPTHSDFVRQAWK